MELTVESLLDKVKDADDICEVALEAMEREGFARKTLMLHKLDRGEIAKIKIRKKDVAAVMATGPSQAGGGQVRQAYIYPPIFQINGSVHLDHMDEAQDKDLTVETLFKVLEATLVREDRLWKQMADKIAINRPGKGINILADMVTELRVRNIKPGTWIWGANVWKHLATSNILDPVSKRQLNTTGFIPMLYGMPIHTDAFRDPVLRVLGPNDVYALPEPEYLGALHEQMPLRITLESGAAIGRPITAIMYQMHESMGMVSNVVRAEI